MPLNLYSTDGKNMLRGLIPKNVAKMPLISSKLAARPLLSHLWVALTWSFLSVLTFDQHQNDQLIETSPIVKRYKLYIIPFRFWFLSYFCHLLPHGHGLHLARRLKSIPGNRFSVSALPITTNSLLKIYFPEKSVTIPPPPPPPP